MTLRAISATSRWFRRSVKPPNLDVSSSLLPVKVSFKSSSFLGARSSIPERNIHAMSADSFSKTYLPTAGIHKSGRSAVAARVALNARRSWSRVIWSPTFFFTSSFTSLSSVDEEEEEKSGAVVKVAKGEDEQEEVPAVSEEKSLKAPPTSPEEEWSDAADSSTNYKEDDEGAVRTRTTQKKEEEEEDYLRSVEEGEEKQSTREKREETISKDSSASSSSTIGDEYENMMGGEDEGTQEVDLPPDSR